MYKTYLLNHSEHKQNSGFITLEILIALVIIVLSVSSVMIIVFGSQQMALDGQLTLQALEKARGLQEQAGVLALADWDNVISLVVNDNPFTKNLNIKDEDDFVKSVISSVTWQTAGLSKSVELATLLFNKDDARAQGLCADAATGDWTHPNSASIALNSTGPATGVDVKNGIAYVAVNGNGTQKDFFAIDIATGNVTCSMDTGPGLLAIKVSGNYAYVANTSINSQLQIIDLVACSFVGYKIPGSNGSDKSNALYYFNHKVYLGMVTSSIEEFHIIDVSHPADITSVHELGTWELNEKVNALYVSNGLAYIASPDNNQELKVLNVRDPAHIQQLPGFNAPGSSGNGRSVTRKNQRLFLGRSTGNAELYLLHMNDLGSGAKASANINSSINGLTTIGNLVFLATTDTAKEFQVYQISDDDTSFAPVSTINLTDKANAIDCENQAIYVASEDPTHGLIIITPN